MHSIAMIPNSKEIPLNPLKQDLSIIPPRLEESNHAPEIKARIDQRMRQLTDMLTHDSTGSSLYAGAGVSKKPVKQLLKLKKVTQATNLFLRNKSLSLKSSIRQIKMEGGAILLFRRRPS